MKKKILFVFPNFSSFVKKDIDILREKYYVETCEFNVKNKIFTPGLFAKQFLFLLFKLKNYDLVICQLAAYHSFLPVLFARLYSLPSLIFLGGTDCSKFPSIGYGNFNKVLLGIFTGWSVRLASHLAPKHGSLINFKYDYDTNDYAYQGIEQFVKGFKTPYTVIENGYDQEKFKCVAQKNAKTFITVAAGVQLPFTIPLKGLDLIISVAPEFPDCKFTIVGVPESYKITSLSGNIVCLPEMPNEELVKLYSEHEFYLQLSMSEGFPNALCEAMLCECIPIGSDVNAIPEIISDSGYILKRRNKRQLVDLLKQVILNKQLIGKLARERILNHYTLDLRKQKLFQLIQFLKK